MSESVGVLLSPRQTLVTSEISGQAFDKIEGHIASIRQKSSMEISELVDPILTWEGLYEQKVSPQEFAALQILSSVLETIKYVSAHHERTPYAALEQSVETEHDVLQTVFQNLKKDGRPNASIVRSFGIVTNVFKDFLNLDTMKVKDSVYDQMYYWQGLMGTATAAFMFKELGWEIRLPPARADIENEVDLIVKNAKGDIYTVDITSKVNMNDGLSGCFRASVRESNPAAKKLINGLSGTIRINVPPVRTQEADDFYENKITGYPGEKGLTALKNILIYA